MKEYSEKEIRILDVAGEMFAEKPFHKVLLSDVAKAASVGKGTLYLYFSSKEDLYFAVLYREFLILVSKLSKYMDNDMQPDEKLSCIIKELLMHMARKAANVELMGRVILCPKDEDWEEIKKKLWGIIENVIVEGSEVGIFKTESPALEAVYITGMIRSACLFKLNGFSKEEIYNHVSSFIFKGLGYCPE